MKLYLLWEGLCLAEAEYLDEEEYLEDEDEDDDAAQVWPRLCLLYPLGQ